MQQTNFCPLCGHKGTEMRSLATSLSYDVTCPRCGVYRIRRAVADDIQDDNHFANSRKYVLSGLTRRATELGEPINITLENIEQLLQSVSVPHNPLEAMNCVLLYLSRNQSTAAERVKLGPDDYPIAFCKDAGELRYCLGFLVEQDAIEESPPLPNEPVAFGHYRLTPSGWQGVSDLRKIQSDSNQAFIAMWFDSQINPIFDEAFGPALESLGYRPIRIDREQFNEKICDQIVAEIRRSGLLIADMTGNRGGVYFEAGFAMGLGIPVIWTCREDYIDQVHFDTRQYNHIVWKNSEDLREKLTYRIEATIPGRARHT